MTTASVVFIVLLAVAVVWLIIWSTK